VQLETQTQNMVKKNYRWRKHACVHKGVDLIWRNLVW